MTRYRTRTPKRFVFAFVGLTALCLGPVAGAVPANAQTASDPIIVTEPVEGRACDETWVVTNPGEPAVTHQEFRYYRDVAAVEEVSHQEFQYKREVPQSHVEYRYAVEERQSIPEYEVATFTRERTRTGQHYCWTGGRLPASEPPTEVPPSDNWQANTQHEPHKPNEAVWVNERLHYTAHSDGFASWFYYGYGNWSDWSEPEQWYANLEMDPNHSWVKTVPAANWQEHGDSYTDLYQRDWAVLPTGAQRPSGDFTPWVVTGHTAWSTDSARPGVDTDTLRYVGPAQQTVDDDPMTVYYLPVDDESDVLTDANWTTRTLGDPWVKVAEKTVVTVEYEPGYRLFFLDGGEPTLEVTDANWTTVVDPDGWVFYDQRTVTDKAAVEPVEVTYKAGWPCGVESETGTVEPPTGVASGTGELPTTGSNATPAIATLAAALVLGGAALTALRRPRKV